MSLFYLFICRITLDSSGTAAVNGNPRERRDAEGRRLQLRDYLGGDSGTGRSLRGSQDVYDGTRGMARLLSTSI